ncbi:MAG: cysteine-rich CWC family protein [Massilia sp.]|nr:cysteine-rich CWC family protein [Massilia sp.]
MSACSHCGAPLTCAMADGSGHPCWCTEVAAAVAVPVPGQGAACWCPACLKQHIAGLARQTPAARNKPISTD